MHWPSPSCIAGPNLVGVWPIFLLFFSFAVDLLTLFGAFCNIPDTTTALLSVVLLPAAAAAAFLPLPLPTAVLLASLLLQQPKQY